MSEKKRYKIELLIGHYGDMTLFTPDTTHKVSDFGKLIEKVDKRLFSQWADGCTIFHLTERQAAKLNEILTTTKD